MAAITKSRARLAIQTLDEMLVLFGRGGAYWLSGDWSRERDGRTARCLVQALRTVDGPAESLTAAILYECAYPTAVRWITSRDEAESVYAKVARGKRTNTASALMGNRVAHGLISYNDAYSWPKIRTLIRRAKRKLQQYA